MCSDKRYIYNRYIHRSVLVTCGTCKSCQQAKANLRSRRIKNHSQLGRLCLFVTLTYDNRFVPYFRFSDLKSKNSTIYGYRDYDFDKHGRVVRVDKSIVSFDRSDIHGTDCFLPNLRHKYGCVGFLLWSDVQKFMKRLRINLKRKLNYEDNITYFAVGEYGSAYHRPHFHLLIYFPSGTLEALRPIIAQSWSYGDMQKSSRRIQQAVNPSSYVAGYVNKSPTLPTFLTSLPIRQKSSHSLHFGADLQCFSILSLLEKADRGDMSYTTQTSADGKPVLANLPIPKYVINRYFPRFKGDSALSPYEIRELLHVPIKLWYYFGNSSERVPVLEDFVLSYCSDVSCSTSLLPRLNQYRLEDYRRFVIHLRHCIDYYILQTGKTEYDYCIDYVRVWTSYNSYILRHSFDGVDSFASFYYNASEFVFDPYIAPTLSTDCFYELDYNNIISEVVRDRSFCDLYDKQQNCRLVNNSILAEIDDEF